MSEIDGGITGRSERRPNVFDVVDISDRGDGFAYVPGEILVRGAGVADRLDELIGRRPEFRSDREGARGDKGWMALTDLERPLDLVELLRAEGYGAQPNHVFFAHGCGRPCPPHPAVVHEHVRSALSADPMRANPMRANPMRANPMRANPMRANSPFESSAVPIDRWQLAPRDLTGPGQHPWVFVLDTGLAGRSTSATGNVTDHRAPLLAPLMAGASTSGTPQVDGDDDLPDVDIPLLGGAYAPADGYLDPAAGHGTFVAGVVEQLAPGCRIRVRRVVGPLGDARETDVADAIHDVVDAVAQQAANRPCIISLSLGGQVLLPPGYLREAVARAHVAGIAIVASAGNDATCTQQYPAAFDDVVAVAALGPDGPAPFTNYGDWVDACAPGIDLVSSFFDNFDGVFPTINNFDADRFSGWAQWSGTSFAVPIVVAAIARELVTGRGPGGGNLTALAAVDRVVGAPHLARLDCLGTIVNI